MGGGLAGGEVPVFAVGAKVGGALAFEVEGGGGVEGLGLGFVAAFAGAGAVELLAGQNFQFFFHRR